MIIEIQVPDDWSPRFGFAMSRLLRETFANGLPVMVAVRPDVSAEELSDAFTKVREVITEAGLSA